MTAAVGSFVSPPTTKRLWSMFQTPLANDQGTAPATAAEQERSMILSMDCLQREQRERAERMIQDDNHMTEEDNTMLLPINELRNNVDEEAATHRQLPVLSWRHAKLPSNITPRRRNSTGADSGTLARETPFCYSLESPLHLETGGSDSMLMPATGLFLPNETPTTITNSCFSFSDSNRFLLQLPDYSQEMECSMDAEDTEEEDADEVELIPAFRRILLRPKQQLLLHHHQSDAEIQHNKQMIKNINNHSSASSSSTGSPLAVPPQPALFNYGLPLHSLAPKVPNHNKNSNSTKPSTTDLPFLPFMTPEFTRPTLQDKVLFDGFQTPPSLSMRKSS